VSIIANARKREAYYFAHPLGRDLANNLARGERWLFWLMQQHPDVTFCAPWMPYVRLFLARFGSDDAGHPFRERCLLDNLRIAMSGFDGIVLTGGRCSPGMELERMTVTEFDGRTSDLTSLGDEPPEFWGPDELPLDFGLRVAAR